MLATYRRILVVPGALLFSGAGLVARLPMSMVGLGIVLLVEAATGSYGLAGAVSATYVAAEAGFAILQGRLLDRLGQARVLVPVVLVFSTAVVLLMVSVQSDWPAVTTYLLAAVGGAALPAAGSCVRARWSYALTGRPADLQTAFAFEAVVDESVFIAGPILVTVLATAIHPVVGLGTAVVAGLAGTTFLAAQRRTEPPAHPRDRAVVRGRLPWRTLGPLSVVTLALGSLFGAAEVVTVAFSEEQGNQAYAGPLLAVWALGSLLAGLVTGAIQWRTGPAGRLRLGALGMFAAMLPLPFIGSVPVMALLLLVGGFADRTQPDRGDLAGRAGGAAVATDGGHVVHPHRDRGGGGAGRRARRCHRRPLRRLGGLRRLGRRRSAGGGDGLGRAADQQPGHGAGSVDSRPSSGTTGAASSRPGPRRSTPRGTSRTS